MTECCLIFCFQTGNFGKILWSIIIIQTTVTYPELRTWAIFFTISRSKYTWFTGPKAVLVVLYTPGQFFENIMELSW